MWLNPLKGAHLTLGQLDKTLPVDMSEGKNKKIERGSIVFISTGKQSNGVPRFQLYTDVEAKLANAVPYVALMGVKDFQAGMAGNVGQAPEAEGIDKGETGGDEWLGKASVVGAGGIRGPRITAISLVQPAEWETTAYDAKVANYYVGQPLTVGADGKVTAWSKGNNIVGYVTAVPHKRHINDLGASVDGARISGGYAKVIAFSTAWIPAAATDPVEDDPETPDVNESKPSNVGMLSVKGDGKPAAPAAQNKPAAPAAQGKPAVNTPAK